MLHALDATFAALARRLGWEEALSFVESLHEDGMLRAKIAALAAPLPSPCDDALEDDA